MKIGTEATQLTDSTGVTLSAADAVHEDAVCKPRWLNWPLPPDTDLGEITIRAEKPVRVYAVEAYKGRS